MPAPAALQIKLATSALFALRSIVAQPLTRKNKVTNPANVFFILIPSNGF
jgi:hypothetical protein